LDFLLQRFGLLPGASPFRFLTPLLTARLIELLLACLLLLALGLFALPPARLFALGRLLLLLLLLLFAA
jgi:hypothetical protein